MRTLALFLPLFVLSSCGVNNSKANRDLIGFGAEDMTDPEDMFMRDRDAACASVSAAATLVKKPVDIIFVIDNSGSMTDEIQAIEKNISVNFASIIGASGLDYRVIMLAKHGSAALDQSICVAPPLSGNATCTPPPSLPTNGARFFHYSYEIASTDSFARILDSYNKPDPSGQQPLGWSGWLRTQAVKVFIEITDDNSSMTALNFETMLMAKTPAMFGTTANRNYIWHTINGLKANTPPTKPWDPADPVQMTLCGTGVYSPGVEYQNLSKTTGGLRFPICEHASFDTVFQAVAMGVIKGAQIACEFDVPMAPVGQTVDLTTVLLVYTPSDGSGSRNFVQVPDSSQCAPDSFYMANGKISLCTDACASVKVDTMAKVEVLFDCEIPIDVTGGGNRRTPL